MMSNEEKLTPFSYLNRINKGQTDNVVVDDSVYSQFLMNRGLSLFIDTIAISNELNMYGGNITNQMHFDYLSDMVEPRMRFKKWPKPKNHEDAQLLAQYYGISVKKAYDYIKLYTKEQLNIIRKELETE